MGHAHGLCLEALDVPGDLPAVLRERAITEVPVDEAHDSAAEAALERARPDHLHAAATVGRGCGDVPLTAGERVDVRIGHGCGDDAGLRPIVAAALPQHERSDPGALGDIGG